MNLKVDTYLSKAKRWRQELEKLRAAILSCGLSEELKWGAPCYTLQKSNIIIIGELKECCVLSFFKGVLLKDVNNILIKPGNNTQSARIIQFTSVQDIVNMEPILKAYIFEAIEIENAGLKVDFTEKTALVFADELKIKFKDNSLLEAAFDALTPGRQRAYNLYFSATKQATTRNARIEKCIPQILNGKGLNDW